MKDDLHGGCDYELSLELNLIRQSTGLTEVQLKYIRQTSGALTPIILQAA